MTVGEMAISGEVSARLIKGHVQAPLSWKIRNSLRPSFISGLLGYKAAQTLSNLTGIPTLVADLRAVKIDGRTGQRIDYGVVSRKLVTTAFVNFLVDMLQVDTTEIGDFKFHDSGVGTTAENAGDTGIETTDGESRATGSQTEGASANIYKSVGTIAYTTTKAITEHGVFSQSTGGTLMDRSVFTAINVVNGDQIEFTYSLTASSGG
jgi:hypothetical protein